MIELDAMGVTFADATEPVLAGVDLTIAEGELTLVVGRTGSGKSTLLRAINGLVPHFSGGTLHGRVVVDGRDTRTHRPRDLADVVGFVGQDPLVGLRHRHRRGRAGLRHGVARAARRRDAPTRRGDPRPARAGRRARAAQLADLSGGQQQRVAIGAVLTTHPRVLVLDEPTSALDPIAAEEVLATLQRLVHDLGLTVVLAEHRLERVVQYADHLVLVPGEGVPLVHGEPVDVLRDAPVAPPVVELGRVAGWHPLPLSVRDARRLAPPLRARLAEITPPPRRTTDGAGEIASVRDVVASYGRIPALRGVTARVTEGEIVAVMGRNGAGKSTLLKALVAMKRPTSGTVEVDGIVPARPEAGGAAAPRRHGAAGPDRPALRTRRSPRVRAGRPRRAACRRGPRSRCSAGSARGCRWTATRATCPRGSGSRSRSSIVLAARPPLLLLDEPTRGLDYTAKHRLVEILRELADEGHAVLLATHDVELVAEVATRVMVMADGEVVADGPTAEVVVSSPAFAPQVAKVLAPQQWLTPTEVAVALASEPVAP